MPNVIAQLNDEWTRLSTDPAAGVTLQRWSHDHPALDHTDAGGLVGWVRRRRDRPDLTDPVLAALAALSPTEPLAARMLLQLMLPALALLAARQRDRDEAASAMVALAYERIRTYPIHRRPRAIAANILMDTRKRYYAANLPEPATNLQAHQWHLAVDDDTLSVDVADLLRTALTRQRIDPVNARLLLLNRVAGVSISELAAHSGMRPSTIRQRLHRTQKQLRACLRHQEPKPCRASVPCR